MSLLCFPSKAASPSLFFPLSLQVLRGPSPLLFPLLHYLVLALLCSLCSCRLISLSSLLFSRSPFPPDSPHRTCSHSPQPKDTIPLELSCLYALRQLFSKPLWFSPSSFLQPVFPLLKAMYDTSCCHCLLLPPGWPSCLRGE